MSHRRKVSKCLCLALLGALGSAPVLGDETEGIVGKNEWLFNKYERLNSTHSAGTAESIDLIGRFNKVLAANGVNLALMMVPLKMRIYSEYLPDHVKLTDFMATNYDGVSKGLQARGVASIDLNTPFLNSPKRNSDTPLFFRLDSHWSMTGAMLGAETLKAGVDANGALKGAFDATTAASYAIKNAKRKLPSKARNLVAALPRNSGPFENELFTPVSVARAQAASEGAARSKGIAIVGSSSSKEWTGFVDALRYVLQRDIWNASVTGDIGPWVGMERYLSSDEFQQNTPKLLIWEWAESTMHAPPDHPYQDSRFVSNNTEWLLRASAWVQASCKPSTVSAKISSVGLAANTANVRGKDVVIGQTKNEEFIEIALDKPIDKLDYLSLQSVSNGSKTITLEGMGQGTATRRFTLSVPGDAASHVVKTPLPSNGKGFTKIRVYPGKTEGFTLKDLQICRLPEDLLK